MDDRLTEELLSIENLMLGAVAQVDKSVAVPAKYQSHEPVYYTESTTLIGWRIYWLVLGNRPRVITTYEPLDHWRIVQATRSAVDAKNLLKSELARLITQRKG